MKTIEVKDILSISGKGGLFKLVAQARNGIVVESLEDKKRHVAPASARVSSMEDIAIFTEGEDVPLCDVFYKMYEKHEGAESISHKSSNDALKDYFKEILPEYDDERVYVSDIKKLIHWYNILHSHKMLNVIDKKEEEEQENTEKEEKKDEKAATSPVGKSGKKISSGKKPGKTV